MKDIALDRQTHGLSLKLTPYGHDLQDVDQIAQTAQQIKIGLLTLLGEWYQDTSKGVPYFTEIMSKAPQARAIESIFRQRIMAVSNVRRITKLEMSLDQKQRYLQVSFECATIWGVIEETISAPLTRGVGNVG